MLIGFNGYIGSGKDTLAKCIQYQGYLQWKKQWGQKHIVPLQEFYDWDDLDRIHYGWEIHKMGEALKQIVCLLIGCKRSDLEDQEFKKKELGPEWDRTIYQAQHWMELHGLYTPMQPEPLRKWATDKGFKWTRTVRELLQEVGTEAMRHQITPDVWVNALFKDYKLIPQSSEGTHWQGHAIDIPVHRDPKYPNWLITDVRFPNEFKAVKDRDGIMIRVNRMPKSSDHPSETSLDKMVFDEVVENKGTIEELCEKAKDLVTKFKLHEYADHTNRGTRDVAQEKRGGTGLY